MKETYYFPHDSNATQDPKMMILLAECGLEGVGMYWILIEILHQQESGTITEEAYRQYIKFYYNVRVGGGTHNLDKIQQVLNTSGLLLNKDGFVYSERVLKNKEYRTDITNKRSFAGKRSAEARANSTSVKQMLNTDEHMLNNKRKGKEIERKESSTKAVKIYNTLKFTNTAFLEEIDFLLVKFPNKDLELVATKVVGLTANSTQEVRWLKFVNMCGSEFEIKTKAKPKLKFLN